MTGECRALGVPPPKAVVVYGASGHGKVVADIARLAGLELAGFLDDDPAKIGGVHFGAPVLAWEAVLRRHERATELGVALGIGSNARREACFARLVAAGLSVPSLVHPAAVVAVSSRLGAGTVVMAGAVVNPDAVVEEGCILNTGSVVEHDNRLGRFVHLSPNATLGGGVSIGDRTHVGLGAVVLPGVVVGADVRVGAGAVVHRPVADATTVIGVPARPLAPRAR
jgi:sugar O-acyltransferase (sialic acid O-acetyltransferase NeuD family)